jgi:hypothetical protein
MTIRQTLRGWFRFLWLGILAIGVLAGNWHATWENHLFRETVLGFLLISVVGVFAFGFRCPRCRTSFLTRSATILNGRPCGRRHRGMAHSVNNPPGHDYRMSHSKLVETSAGG